jgi:hypothetical protein
MSRLFYARTSPGPSGGPRAGAQEIPAAPDPGHAAGEISTTADNSSSVTEEDRCMTAMQILQVLEVIGMAALLMFTAYVQP